MRIFYVLFTLQKCKKPSPGARNFVYSNWISFIIIACPKILVGFGTTHLEPDLAGLLSEKLLMEDIRTRPLSAFETVTWKTWLPQAVVLLYLMTGMIIYMILPFLALDWMRLPFLGGFVEKTLVFNNLGPTGDPETWPAYQQGITAAQPRLLAIDGRPIRRVEDLHEVLRERQVGDVVTVEVRSQAGETSTHAITLSRFPSSDQAAYFYTPYIIGLIYLCSALWVFSVRRGHASGQAYTAFAVSVALSIGLIYDLYTSNVFPHLWTIALALTGGSLVPLMLYFPRETTLVRRYPYLPHIWVAVSLLLGANGVFQLLRYDAPMAYQQGWRLEYLFIGLSLVVVIGGVLYNRTRITAPNEREQLRLMGIGGLFSFGPMALWLLLTSTFHIPFAWPWLLPLVIFPVLAGYTVQRYRMLQADFLLSRAVQIALMVVMVTIGYALITAGVTLLLGNILVPNSPVGIAIIFFLTALAFIPMRDQATRLVDSVFFRGRKAYQDRLQTFSGELTHAVDLPGIIQILRRYVEETLVPSRLHIFVYDTLSDQYIATPDASGNLTTDLRFPVISGLVIRLSEQTASLVIGEFSDMPAVLEPDRARLTLLGAQAFVPLPGRQRLSGWMALGPRLSGEPYTSQQISYLEALCDQAALAIERAQVVANMENRVREMNVLTRVAQGVNITLTLDDILELVYAQTIQIIPADDFHIMLFDRDADTYQYAFYLENDDRVDRMENRPIAPGQALEQEVIRQRRPILTDDYGRECQRRGVLAGRRNLYAWVGVPLNTGAETIGALSLGNADPAVEYTPEQLNLLQAIADQVAGALTKARLLAESQRRARQLATLNEVTRQLTSTLETEPLLHNILQSACDILNCEAGSLLMMDPHTNELVFRSVVSPVAGDLLGKRMPADRGVAGKSVKTRESIIVNDVTKFPEWFPAPDKQTGFVTRAILVIPLIVKDRVIGVLEVLNKRDGTIFSQDDLDLLAAFASQAAVAIENANLYTMTDQALAARVEELSVMQRIDRELNTSLDPARAMRITLDWSMRQSGAHAGLVGIVQGDGEESPGLQIMASQGYQTELDAYQNALLPTREFNLQDAIREGMPVRRTLQSGEKGLFARVRSQAIIPIRRETTTIGLILLESESETSISDDTLNFLVRLSDHASIAIYNAQLYAAVQQANLAKSDFVSFVAHELKNPMTSVKGYTELISAGAVGPINEVQANFLGTIRANIERMNTLVSDLNDMSKIEVGRLRLDFKALHLNDAMEEVIRSIRKQVEEKNQTLQVNLPPDLPTVWADRVRLVQVLVNLVSNAHKYTPAGGMVEIAAERCKNEWDPAGAPEVVHVWVRDNGIGISEEDQKKIFQKFFRSDDPKTREVTGTGLGLNITKSLVEMQGGKIWFESEFRKGTTFHITIPISE